MAKENEDMVSSPTVIYEDKDMQVINKPAGLIVHFDGRNEESSVVDWVKENYPDIKDVGEEWVSPQGVSVARPGIVHRLDKTTSGVMVIAKTQSAFDNLKKQFQDRVVVKKYDALVYGQPKEDIGVIEAEIGRTKKKPRKWIAEFAHGKTRAAITDWKVVGRYTDLASEEKISHMELEPKTGRTHQIRVHLKAIHHPIICDHIYAKGKPCVLGFERPALHARSLTLAMPSGKTKTFEAPLPNDFAKAFAEMGA
jgi:23S rRNA pseudouridine1911/1915/1917 synthase